MADAGAAEVRQGRLSDFRSMAALYSGRDGPARTLFHPFPEGRLVVPATLFLLLLAQRAYGLLVRLRPSWGFRFVVHAESSQNTVDGFVYLRVRRRSSGGYVANIGTLVGPQARGRGIGPAMIRGMIDRVRRLRVCGIETQTYAANVAMVRMAEKMGFRVPEDPSLARVETSRGPVVTYVMDLERGGAGRTGPTLRAGFAHQPGGK